MHKLTRICYNENGWEKPSGKAREVEGRKTFYHNNNFGHEEWLFRHKWSLGNWRYAFIQGINKSGKPYLNQPLDLTLFTIQCDKRVRWVAEIKEVECLTDTEAAEALNLFKENGWLEIMRHEVESVKGAADAIGDEEWAKNILNVRFRRDNVHEFPPNTFAPNNDQWLKDRHRYQLYDFPSDEITRLVTAVCKRRGTHIVPETKLGSRRGSQEGTVDPMHSKMQQMLFDELKKEYGDKAIMEENFVDVTVRTDKEITLYEIKSDIGSRSAIRHALGQILEYAYYPPREYDLPVRLVIVGRTSLDKSGEEYLRILKENHSLAIGYKTITVP